MNGMAKERGSLAASTEPVLPAREGAPDASDVARAERTDAVTSGLLRKSGDRKAEGRDGMKTASKDLGRVKPRKGRRQAMVQKNPCLPEAKSAFQARMHLAAAAAGAMADGSDGSDDSDTSEDMAHVSRRGAQALGRRSPSVDRAPADSVAKDARPEAPAGRADRRRARAGKRRADAELRRSQSRRTWMRARATNASEAANAAKAAGETARKGSAKAIAGAAASAAAPAAGVLAGVLCFVLAVLVVSQLASAIFGFWKSEAERASLDGLPPYITVEMDEAALEWPERYGTPQAARWRDRLRERGRRPPVPARRAG